MDVHAKLTILADAAKYDASCASSGSKRAAREGGIGDTNKIGICHSYTPDGRCVSLLKILLTNYCTYDCQYCINRISSDIPRARFTLDEVVWLTIQFYKRNYIEGLFLSSGIIQSPDYTMEQLIGVARKLRVDEKYNGYIHLKAVPGASRELMWEAGKWADRLSANIELPTPADLTKLAPEKMTSVIHEAMSDIGEKVAEAKAETSSKAPTYAPAGQSTQVIVGATPSPDAAILATASDLYQRFKLRRVYYSAFSPIPKGDGRLPLVSPPLIREHRLYQSDWLMRFYGYRANELTSAEAPNLDLEIDPKLAWALRRRDFFPVDINRASKWQLLRVPGLGVRNVMKILSLRRLKKICLDDLSRLRVNLTKARPFIIASDHSPARLGLDRDDLRQKIVKRDVQLNLFETAVSARSGDV